jgi:hypothetical protein
VPPLAAAQGEGFGIGVWSDDLEVRRSGPYPNEARRIGAGGVLLRADQSVRDVDDGRNGDLAARRRTGTETPASLPHSTRCGRTDRAKTVVTCPNQDAQPAIGPTLPAPDLASGRSGPHDRFCSPGASNRAIGLARGCRIIECRNLNVGDGEHQSPVVDGAVPPQPRDSVDSA